jgi:hypothetical protein
VALLLFAGCVGPELPQAAVLIPLGQLDDLRRNLLPLSGLGDRGPVFAICTFLRPSPIHEAYSPIHRPDNGAHYMMIALILVFLTTTVSDMGDCTRDNALDVVYVPTTFGSPVSCLMHAQAYLADS